ncbi:MAG: phosphatidylserine decarboxylase family protein [Rhodospirillaceae bacterium]|nr:phosphatidylserine decarboxylase family protein [Rhodospirillaceae bacterium]
MLKSVLVPINRAGWPFIGILATITALSAYYYQPLGWVGVILTFWCAYFFRDPDRTTPVRDGLVISPADGVVQSIGLAAPPAEIGLGDTPRNRISIFMNVFDVHVNRIPIAGRIVKLAYRQGKFFNASLDKASEFNERQSFHLKTEDGADVGVVQIAGLIARRIKCDLSEEQSMKAGERFGLIRFGSRVDVFLPNGVPPMVAVGQRAIAGETVIADFRAQEPARNGEIR